MRKSFKLLVVISFIGAFVWACGSSKKVSEVVVTEAGKKAAETASFESGVFGSMSKNLETVSFVVTPEVLKEKGGFVEVKIDVTFPAKYFAKNTMLGITPVLRFNEGEVAFPAAFFQGEKYKGNYQVISYTEGGTVTISGKVPYQEGMRMSSLQLDFVGSKGKENIPFGGWQIAKGVVATATLAVKAPVPAFAEDQYVRIVPEQKEGDINFLANTTRVRKAAAGDLQDVVDYIVSFEQKEGLEVTGITVKSYASPDGSQAWNEKVAGKRGAKTAEYVSAQLTKQGVDIAEINLQNEVTPEDWAGFQEAVNNSNIADKEIIIRVLSNIEDPIAREKALRDLGAVYSSISSEIYPELRRTVVMVDAQSIGKSDEELKALAVSDPNSLTVEELLRGASMLPCEDALAAYNACKAQYPEDWRGYNNAAVIEMHKGNLNAAKANLNAAKKISDAKKIVSNLAGVSFLEGKNQEAKLGYDKGCGCVKNVNLATIALFEGDYAKAVKLFGEEKSYNAAVANVMVGNYQAAKDMLSCECGGECAQKCQACAKKSYLKAVIAALQNKDAEVITNLKEAVKGNAHIAKLAATDMVFAKYFDTEAFKALSK